MTVALAMSAELLARGGTEEDRLLESRLERAGEGARAVAWDSDADWRAFSAVVVRSCWDYHRRPTEFDAWLERLEGAGVETWNRVPLLRWNMDKRYLLDLAARGVPVVPSEVRSEIAPPDLDELRRSLGSDDLVIKPVVGATSFGCRLLRGGEGLDAPPEVPGPWLAQPFVDAVVAEGEWSLMLFEGRLSHAVLKRPIAGEYRVQKEFGGSAERRRAPADLAATARRVIETLDTTPLYARVDLARWRGEPRLMELELIEPELYLRDGDPGLEVLLRRLVRGREATA